MPCSARRSGRLHRRSWALFCSGPALSETSVQTRRVFTGWDYLLFTLLTAGLIQASPFDNRVLIRVLLGLICWYLLSRDYTSLSSLIDGIILIDPPPSILWINQSIQHLVFATPVHVICVQGIAILLCLVSILRPTRWVIALTLIPVLVLEWCAYQFRGQLYDLDVPLAILLLIIFWPRNFSKIASSDKGLTSDASLLRLAIVLYLGTAYFLAAASKIQTGMDWWREVHLELAYPAVKIWHGAKLPDGTLDETAFLLQRIFEQSPALSQSASLLTMALELSWFLAAFSRAARITIPLLMLHTHIFIFLSTGILFLSLAAIAVCAITPWRLVISQLTVSLPSSRPKYSHWVRRLILQLDWFHRINLVETNQDRIAATCADSTFSGPLASLLLGFRLFIAFPISILAGLLAFPLLVWSSRQHIIPSQALNPTTRSWMVLGLSLTVPLLGLIPACLQNHFFPFANYFQFGWTYASANQPAVIYRMAYESPTTGEIKPIPLNYCGFMDFRWVSLGALYAKLRQDAPNLDQRQDSDRRIFQLRRSLRPHRSNQTLLGPLAYPNHLISGSEDIPMSSFKHLFILKGLARLEKGEVQVTWLEWVRLGQD
jgi:hypothetical protein